MGYYEIEVSQTSRRNMKDTPRRFSEETYKFKSLGDAQQYLLSNYGHQGKVRRGTPIYRDMRGKSVRTGQIFGSWQQDYNRDSGKRVKYFQQDWVELRKVKHSYLKW
jgi:hypothetical protein